MSLCKYHRTSDTHKVTPSHPHSVEGGFSNTIRGFLLELARQPAGRKDNERVCAFCIVTPPLTLSLYFCALSLRRRRSLFHQLWVASYVGKTMGEPTLSACSLHLFHGHSTSYHVTPPSTLSLRRRRSPQHNHRVASLSLPANRLVGKTMREPSLFCIVIAPLTLSLYLCVLSLHLLPYHSAFLHCHSDAGGIPLRRYG